MGALIGSCWLLIANIDQVETISVPGEDRQVNDLGNVRLNPAVASTAYDGTAVGTRALPIGLEKLPQAHGLA